MITFILKLYIIFTFIFTHTSTRYITNGYEVKDLFTDGSLFHDALDYWSTGFSFAYKFFDCGGQKLLGGAAILILNGYTGTVYTGLQPHNVVYFSIQIYLQGYYTYSDFFRVVLKDGSGTNTMDIYWAPHENFPLPIFGGNCCGCWDLQFKGRGVHSDTTLGLTIASGNSPFCSIGFRLVYLKVATVASPSQYSCVNSNAFPSNGWNIDSLCPCPAGTFEPSCTACDPACKECYGPSAGECFACEFGYYFDGTQCLSCTTAAPTCTTCGTCTYCADPDFYFYGECVPDCNLPFLKSIQGDRRFCFSPCEDTEIVFADGTCTSTCPTPLVETPVYSRRICKLPCPGTKTTYYDGTTVQCLTTPCGFPFKDRVYGGALKVCEYPCDPGLVYYPHNLTCLPSCDFPFVPKTYGAIQMCEKPCPATQYYTTWDLVCRSNCPPLLQKEFMQGVWICHPPKCGAQYCKTCGPAPTYQCQDYYFCNTTVSAFCEPYYKYQLKVEPIRPLLNGVELLVSVDPLLGIEPGVDDYLELSVIGFEVHTDYVYTINKLGTGTFQVEIFIQRQVNSTAMKTSFEYGGGLSNFYTLPRLTYIDESTQLAAKTVKQGSQIAFLIFAISIIGTVLGGGMSSLWTAMPESQYAYYLMYLNVDYLHHTEVYFESLSSYDVLISNDGEEDDDHLDISYRLILPRKFFLLDYLPDFIGNTEDVFTQTLAVLVGLTIAAIAIKYIRFSGRGMWVLRGLRWVRNGFMWNMLIRQMLTYALPLYIACFVQMYSAMFSGTAYLPSMILAVLTMLFFFVFFMKMLSIINKMPNNKQEMAIYERKFGTLWEDLDTSMISKYYYWLVAVRGSVLAYLIVFFSVYPYVQVCSVILCQCCVVSLFFRKWGIRQVFEDSLLSRIIMTEEISLLFTKILILVYMIMINYVGDKTLILVGWFVVIPGSVNQIIQTLYSTGIQIHEKIQDFRAIQGMLEKRRLKRLKKIRRINRAKMSPLRVQSPTRHAISTTDIDLNSTFTI